MSFPHCLKTRPCGLQVAIASTVASVSSATPVSVKQLEQATRRFAGVIHDVLKSTTSQNRGAEGGSLLPQGVGNGHVQQEYYSLLHDIASQLLAKADSLLCKVQGDTLTEAPSDAASCETALNATTMSGEPEEAFLGPVRTARRTHKRKYQGPGMLGKAGRRQTSTR
jgi:hypothetical protein